MEAFDFNQFQRQIFREIFSDPLQKIPERETPVDVKHYVSKKRPNNLKATTQSAKKGRGRPKGTIIRKKEIEHDDFKVVTERKFTKIKKTPPKESLSKKKQNVIKTICKTPMKVQTTAFEIHQKSAEIEKSQKNVRRSLRAKLKKRKSVEVVIEIIEKEFDEITSQHEFLHFLGLNKKET